MPQSPLFQDDYRPRFSGHQTFALRYGWLKKVFDAVSASTSEAEAKSIFLSESAIEHFGVGKNMVASMRYWADATDIIANNRDAGGIQTTKLGRTLFANDGHDPYMEHPATLWLMHWQLAAHPEQTTWFWAFNNYQVTLFDREHLVKSIVRVAKERGWPRATVTTIEKDVSCFIRTYVPQRASSRTGPDDTLESPLTELGLIQETNIRDRLRFVRGPKPSLGNGVFTFALLDFWSRFSPQTATLSFESVVYEAGSPGRVFLLDENDIVDRLVDLDASTRGAIRWSETAGLKQVVRRAIKNDAELNLMCIAGDYPQNKKRCAA